jgi:hypothetical protein
MPPYYLTGALGAVSSLLALLPPEQALTASTRLMLLGMAMAPIMWATALHAIKNWREYSK